MTYEELKSKVTSQYDLCTLWVETQKDGEYVKECAFVHISYDYPKIEDNDLEAVLMRRYFETEDARLRVVNSEGVTRYELRKGIFIGTGREGLE